MSNLFGGLAWESLLLLLLILTQGLLRAGIGLVGEVYARSLVGVVDRPGLLLLLLLHGRETTLSSVVYCCTAASQRQVILRRAAACVMRRWWCKLMLGRSCGLKR